MYKLSELTVLYNFRAKLELERLISLSYEFIRLSFELVSVTFYYQRTQKLVEGHLVLHFLGAPDLLRNLHVEQRCVELLDF